MHAFCYERDSSISNYCVYHLLGELCSFSSILFLLNIPFSPSTYSLGEPIDNSKNLKSITFLRPYSLSMYNVHIQNMWYCFNAVKTFEIFVVIGVQAV